jgi:hypothetical protein
MISRIIAGLAIVVAVSACSAGGPTDPAHVASGPTLDSGVMHGSGNRSDSTAAATSSEATAAEKDDTGVMHGSGN